MRGSGISGCAGRIAGIVAPQVVVYMYATGGVKDVLLVIIGALAVMVAVLLFFGIETNQRSLEEIAPDAPDSRSRSRNRGRRGARGQRYRIQQHH